MVATEYPSKKITRTGTVLMYIRFHGINYEFVLFKIVISIFFFFSFSSFLV